MRHPSGGIRQETELVLTIVAMTGYSFAVCTSKVSTRPEVSEEERVLSQTRRLLFSGEVEPQIDRGRSTVPRLWF